MSERRLTGKNALVCGGESGIGAAIVRRFAAEGASVLVGGVQDALLTRLAHETGATAMLCDVTDEGAVGRTVDAAARRPGGLHIVVNAAGIMHADNVADIEDSVWERMLAVNLSGTMRVCRASIPHMINAGGGAIVNIASVAAFNGSAGMASYATSKAGLIAFTRALANEYGKNRIRANTLCPGWVRTAMSEAEMADTVQGTGATVESAFAALGSRIALGRVAHADEIAAAALFLASDDASFVTGASLVVDGGARAPAAARGI